MVFFLLTIVFIALILSISAYDQTFLHNSEILSRVQVHGDALTFENPLSSNGNRHHAVPKLSNGIEKLSSISAIAGLGVRFDMNLDITAHGVSVLDYQNWLHNIKNCFLENDYQSIESVSPATGLLRAFGSIFHLNQDHFKNQQSQPVIASTDAQSNFLNLTSTYLMDSEIHLMGNVTVQGVSEIPSEFHLYIEITTFVFDNNRSIHVMDSSTAYMADQTGSKAHTHHFVLN